MLLQADANEQERTRSFRKGSGQFNQMFQKITAQAALNAEMDEHMGYEKHQQSSMRNINVCYPLCQLY
jgi:putative transposase